MATRNPIDDVMLRWRSSLSEEEKRFFDSLSLEDKEVLADIDDDAQRTEALKSAIQHDQAKNAYDRLVDWYLKLQDEERRAWDDLTQSERDQLAEIQDEEARTKAFQFLIRVQKEDDERAKKQAKELAQASKERWKKIRKKIEEKGTTVESWAKVRGENARQKLAELRQGHPNFQPTTARQDSRWALGWIGVIAAGMAVLYLVQGILGWFADLF